MEIYSRQICWTTGLKLHPIIVVVQIQSVGQNIVFIDAYLPAGMFMMFYLFAKFIKQPDVWGTTQNIYMEITREICKSMIFI